MTLDYGNYGIFSIFLAMSNAGFTSSTVVLLLLLRLLLRPLLPLLLLLPHPPLVRRRSLSSWMFNMFNESCRGPRCGVAKTRIVHTAAAIVSRWDIEKQLAVSFL